MMCGDEPIVKLMYKLMAGVTKNTHNRGGGRSVAFAIKGERGERGRDTKQNPVKCECNQSLSTLHVLYSRQLVVSTKIVQFILSIN